MNLRSIFNEKEAAKTGACGRPEEHVHVAYFGGNAGGAAGGKGYLIPFLRRRPRDGGCPQRSTGRRCNSLANDVRVSPTDEGAGAVLEQEV